MNKRVLQISAASLLLLGTAAVHAHSSGAIDGSVEIGGGSFIKDGNGNAVKTGDGECTKTGTFDADAANATCLGQAPAAEEPKAEAEPVKEPEPVEQEVAMKTVSMSGKALFATGSDQLSGDGEAAMFELIEQLKGMQEISSISVVGHTDSVGTVENNQALSERRAQTVSSYIGAAFPGVAIDASGMGESSPVASNDTAEGKQANRRVEVTVAAKSVN